MKTDNELIAEFMGDDKIHPSKRRYERSWDWLMPVVGKIEKLPIVHTVRHYYSGDGYFTAITPDNGHNIAVSADKSSKIESYYEAVVKFIKWYNTQPQ